MKRRTIDGDEFDAVEHRHHLVFLARAGVASAIKRRMRRRERHEAADQRPRVEQPDPMGDPFDCQHGCNGACVDSGSDRCNFTCHEETP